MYGNGYENMGLGEYPVAASSERYYISKIWFVSISSTRICNSSYQVTGTEDIIGSLNGVFYTDATTKSQRSSNYLQAANTATDIVAFWLTTVRYSSMKLEVMSADTGASAKLCVGDCTCRYNLRMQEVFNSKLYVSKINFKLQRV